MVMLWVLLLAGACRDAGTTWTGLPTQRESDSVLGAGDTAHAGRQDTADTAADTATDTGGEAPLPVAASWRDDADHFTVRPDEGLAWELDPDFRLQDYTVPHVFIGPDGRFGMLATHMASPDFTSRSVLWSEDGVTWEEGGALLRVSDFPYDCGARLEDSAVWREDAETWTVVALGGPETEGGGFGRDPRHFCAASTTDLHSFGFTEAPLFDGLSEDDRPSVPSLIELEDLGSMLFYNGDILSSTPEGPGIRVLRVTPGSHEVAVVHGDPLLPSSAVDPHPVYIEGGGVRLYHAVLESAVGSSGLAARDLDGALLPTDADPGIILTSPGSCNPGPGEDGRCFVDPSLVRAADGRLYVYFSDVTYTGRELDAAVGRAVAVD